MPNVVRTAEELKGLPFETTTAPWAGHWKKKAKAADGDKAALIQAYKNGYLGATIPTKSLQVQTRIAASSRDELSMLDD
jgi:hypothetical protein